jgi:ABC-type branched-subunit amino acid transport system ATPase component
MLTLAGITSGYVREINILQDVSLEAEEGHVTGLIGPNGAGKSTLLKTVFGLLRPRQGKILFAGSEIQGQAPDALKKMGMSFMLQEYSVFPHLSVHENLLLGAWIFRHDRRRLKARLEEIYRFFPVLAERRSERATNLSGGMLRMLCIAKEIMTEPNLLLLDEPSCGLSPKIVSEIYSFLKIIAGAGTTILLVDQNIMKALEVSDYMYYLEVGQVTRSGPKEDFELSIRDIIRDSFISGSPPSGEDS